MKYDLEHGKKFKILARAIINKLIGRIAGFEGIICGASAIYTGLAQVINDHHGKSMLPL